MKFTVIRSRFLEFLASIQNIVPSKPAVPIIANALIEAKNGQLTVMATDLSVSVRAMMTSDVKIDEEGATTLPVRTIVELLRLAPEGEVQFYIDDSDVAKIVTAATNYRVSGLSKRDFPNIQEPVEDAKCFTLDRSIFREMLRKTNYAVCTDETRRVLTGVLLQFTGSKLTMVATDGKRLALVEQELADPTTENVEMILPPKAVTEMLRLFQGGEGPIKIYSQQNMIVVDCGTYRFYSTLIEGVYAKYQSVIPETCDERISLQREELMTAIQRVAIMSNDKAYAVNFQFKEGVLTLTATDGASDKEATAQLPIKYAGQEIRDGYNPTYIMDCLKNLDTEEVTFEMSTSHRPSVIKCDNIPFLYVIMPLRINL